MSLNFACYAQNNISLGNNSITITANINNISNYLENDDDDEEVLNVDSESSLCHAVKIATNNTNSVKKIIVTKDISLSQPLVIESNIDIDLDGHKITIKDPEAQFLIGKKNIVEKSYEMHIPGKFVSRDDYIWVNGTRIIKHNTVYVPGHNETYHRYDVHYEKDITVSISNGNIKGCTPDNAEHTEKAYWHMDAYGMDGGTPKEVFNLISGKLFLNNVSVVCGNGSNGGNATYSAVWHIPLIGGGDGADGGRGGDGGSVFFSEDGSVTVDSKCKFVPGKPGRGGKGSKGNPNCWILKGSTGRDGKRGRNGSLINERSKISFVN